MANERTDAVLRQVQRLFSQGTVGGLDDGQLLERFISGGDGGAEGAFEALVSRHGPMVLRVCRDVLNDPHDAQDAFQATFLVLVRRAHSIRRRESVASWLYGVARRVSSKARTRVARRRSHERQVAGTSHEGVTPCADRLDLNVLHEEIDRLSEKFREPIVLCYLEGMSYEMAASHLGVNESTVRGRLARGRERLRSRLTRRGVTVPAALLVAGNTTVTASATITPTLAASTARVAVQLSAGEAIVATTIASSVMTLTEGALISMLLTKVKVIGLCVVSLCLVTVGVGTLVGQQQSADKAKLGAAPPRSDKPPQRQKELDQQLRSRLVDRARRRVEAQQKFYVEGRITLDRFLDALTQLKDAQLQDATTRDEKVAAVEKWHEEIIEVGARERAELEIGRGTVADLEEVDFRQEQAAMELRQALTPSGPLNLESLDRRLIDVESKLDMILQSISPSQRRR